MGFVSVIIVSVLFALGLPLVLLEGRVASRIVDSIPSDGQHAAYLHPASMERIRWEASMN